MNQIYQFVTYREDTTQPNHIREKQRELITHYCVRVAKHANFPTDYQDVYDHLFGDPSYTIQFIVPQDKENPGATTYHPDMEILGFLVACQFKGYKDTKILHCHGIILDPIVQKQGLAKQMLNQLIQTKKPDILTAKTHNPRAFNTFADTVAAKRVYPNLTNHTPDDIYQLVKQNPFINTSDEKLIVRNAYPDEKIQQTYRNATLKNIFTNVHPNDAQSIVVVYQSHKLELDTQKETTMYQGGCKCLKKSVPN